MHGVGCPIAIAMLAERAVGGSELDREVKRKGIGGREWEGWS